MRGGEGRGFIFKKGLVLGNSFYISMENIDFSHRGHGKRVVLGKA